MLGAMDESSDPMPVERAVKKQLVWLTTTILWMVNIAMLVAIYAMFSKGPTIAGVFATIGGAIALFAIPISGS
jgi:uncharacterized membrane-anchored protein